jgi:hypothetical protein
VKQKWVILFTRVILLAPDGHTKMKFLHFGKIVVVLGMEALFKNKFATSENFSGVKKKQQQKK